MHQRADNHDLVKLGAIIGFIGLICLWVVFVTSCRPKAPDISAGVKLTSQQVRVSYVDDVSDESYSMVRRDSIRYLQDTFESTLFDLTGITKWDSRFDCNHFAEMWKGVASSKFAALSWHSFDAAQSPAIAEIWFTTRLGGRHAILQIVTDAGTIYWEPQPPGTELNLSPAEIASITLRKW